MTLTYFQGHMSLKKNKRKAILSSFWMWLSRAFAVYSFVLWGQFLAGNVHVFSCCNLALFTWCLFVPEMLPCCCPGSRERCDWHLPPPPPEPHRHVLWGWHAKVVETLAPGNLSSITVREPQHLGTHLVSYCGNCNAWWPIYHHLVRTVTSGNPFL